MITPPEPSAPTFWWNVCGASRNGPWRVRRHARRVAAMVWVIGCIARICLLTASSAAAERPNVLFVMVDDLRPELGCYGNREIKTPCFDEFSDSATTFMQAFCQAAVCAA